MDGGALETPSGKWSGDENFPVGSWLLSARLRPHVAAFYALARTTDDIADTLDYKAVAKRLIQFVESSEFQLVEALAEHCARIVLDEFPVGRVRLKLSKPGAVRGSSAVGVTLVRQRPPA